MNTNVNSNTSVGQEIRLNRWQRHEAFVTLSGEYRGDKASLASDCKVRLDAAATEEQKVVIREECRVAFAALVDQFRADVKVSFNSQFGSVLTNMRAKLTVLISVIQTWPQERQDELKTRLTSKLDRMEEKAMQDNNEETLTLIIAIREMIAQI